MTEKSKKERRKKKVEGKDEAKTKLVKIKLRPEVFKRLDIDQNVKLVSIGIPQIDKILEKYEIINIESPIHGKYDRLTGVKDLWYVLVFPFKVDVKEVIQDLLKTDEIETAEPGIDIVWHRTPNDPTIGWHIATIDSEDAWDDSDGTGMVIAVIDTGVDRNHNDLNGHWDGGDNTRTVDHGTNVAGICGAETNNNLGVAGMGWAAHIRGYNFNNDAQGASDIRAAVDAGVDVINMSWGLGDPNTQPPQKSDSVKDALRYAYRRGVVCVASAGNDDWPIPYDIYPGAYKDYVISVGATNNADQRTNWSNYGSWLDVMAPGDCIPTTDPRTPDATGALVDRYNNCFSGTSAAAPVVSGIAALMKRQNFTLGPRQVKEILRETTEIPAGINTTDNRYGKGRVNARKALLASDGIWKTVRYNNAASVGSAVAISESGWWIVAYSMSVFVGYKNQSWSKMVYYDSVADAEPTVDINNNGDWIVNYSKSTFVGYRTQSAVKMVYYPRRQTRGAVAINDNGDWIACYSLSTFVGYKTSYCTKMIYYNNVPNVPGDVDINENGYWICCYSKSTFVGYKTSSCTKMVYYDRVANTASSVDINDNGDWIVNYSKSTFVGYRMSSCSKMVYYDRRSIPGDVAINENGNWICCYSKSTFVGYRTSSCSKMVYYDSVADAGASVDINDNGDWIVNYSKSTFVGYKTSTSQKMVYYPRRTIRGDVAINQDGDWIAVYSLSTFIGHKTSWSSKRVYYDDVPRARGSVDINENGDWIVNYSHTTFVGRMTQSIVKAVRYAPDDMSKDDISNGYSYPSSSLPISHGAVAINDEGDSVACYSRSSHTGNRELHTNTNNF